MSIVTKRDKEEAFDTTRDEEPIYKINSVIDWLEYKKY
jgi:hypothetical protein